MPGRFGATWMSTGPTSLLLSLVRRGDLLQLPPDAAIPADPSVFEPVTDLSRIDAKALLLQAGYLTLSDGTPDGNDFYLKIPNEEIRRSYEALCLNQAAGESDCNWKTAFREALRRGSPEEAFPLLKSLFVGFPYGSNEPVHEAQYRRIVMALFPNFARCAEEPNPAGNRSDLILTFDRFVDVTECKNIEADTAGTTITQRKAKG